MTEFGGWGIRGVSRNKILGFNSNGRALNVKGNLGMQLELKDGGKLLIGTQNPDKVKLSLNNYSYKLKGNNVVS